ncbi:MAG: class I SAM-dependent methyltransferase [Actinomycetia bacterium]|nr:class I SAM-dependent methyltransferase [Actinomycetes bacterium]
MWEWLFIIEALHERDMLRPGRRGLGFGVGQDPMTALFAGLGCEITATDMDPDAADQAGWVETGQHASTLEHLNGHGLCEPDEFAERVDFRTVDMNHIPADLDGYDFTWSACAFEHLGSITRGQELIFEQMRCLRRGGVGVHTTEFNVSSNRRTIATGGTVVFRRRDIDWMADHLRSRGHSLTLDYDPGSSEADNHVDTPPFSNTHLKILIGEHVATSMALVVEKGRAVGTDLMPPIMRARDYWLRAQQAAPTMMVRGHELVARLIGRGR